MQDADATGKSRYRPSNARSCHIRRGLKARQATHSYTRTPNDMSGISEP